MSTGGAQGAQATVEEILRGNQIRTVFQPIVNLRAGTVKGWEALSRGPSGTKFEEPREMFEAAEGRMLDRHCCSTALSAARGLPKDTKLFINILPSSLYDPSLVEVFEQQDVGVERIVLEISERQTVEDTAKLAEAMRRFTDRGFEVAVDNVGSGYSGLERVAHLHPSYLKLHRSLVQNIDTSHALRKMIRALESLTAKNEGALIATGVEREEELKALKEMGVEYGQGWLLGRPIDTPGSGSPGEPTAT